MQLWHILATPSFEMWRWTSKKRVLFVYKYTISVLLLVHISLIEADEEAFEEKGTSTSHVLPLFDDFVSTSEDIARVVELEDFTKSLELF